MKELIHGNPEIGYLAAGGASAFVMAILRTQRWTRKRFALRLVEAFMCSMLSTAVSIGLVQYADVSFLWSIPIGTLTGFIGTDVIHSAIVGWIEYNTLKLKHGHEDSTDPHDDSRH